MDRINRGRHLVSRIILSFGVILIGLSGIPSIMAAPSSDMEVILDASEVSRKIVHSRITVNSGGESMAVLYPKWIPGLHGPTGAIENLAGFKLFDRLGNRITWERDFADPFRFQTHSSADQFPVTIHLSYICNQPTRISWGSDIAATPTMATINWNVVTVYPEGAKARELKVSPRIVLPHGWKFATAMPVKDTLGDTIVFETVSYEELIDYPVICGLYLNTYILETTTGADYYIHVVVDEETLLPHADSAFASVEWNRLNREAEAMFGRTHFDEYHYLVTISDSIRHYGLEHRNSSANSLGSQALTEYGETRYNLQYLLPHEFVHAWCGKYRRPDGMSTWDYQTPKNMEMLWVYEGLTSYLGDILSARSGLVPQEYFMDDIADYWGNLKRQTGREWRSLRDIAVSTHTVWGGSESWAFQRRDAAYYPEGELTWLEVDARIRDVTENKRSLDDFCKAIFGTGDPEVHSVPYSIGDLVAVLGELAEYNWDSLFTVRIAGVSEKLDETPLHMAGYEFNLDDKKPKSVLDDEAQRKCRYYYESLGFAVAQDDAKIMQIVPGSPGDLARLSTGMSIIGVNGKTFSFDRLDKAITDAMNTGKLTLLVRQGETLGEHTIQYGEGLRYISIEPIEGQKDWLSEIIKPVAAK